MLFEKLDGYGGSDYYGFHMPGHKRNPQFTPEGLPYRIDITEIDEFDDLHHADGILKEAQERASRLYHSGETHFLINGSTVGILSAVFGCTKRGERILMARNCHKSVYHAVLMRELEPVYVYPQYLQREQISGEVRAKDVRRILEEVPDIKAVVVVSPTYDGVVSDIRAIAGAAHEKGIPLVVDEAHGAHFGFAEGFPENANELGADIVIHSLHKTLPSMTQTALLHMNGAVIDREEVRMYLHMLQSSSPSYVLMASMDACMEVLEKSGTELFRAYRKRLECFRKEMGGLRVLRLVQTEHFDPSKLVISAAGALKCGSRFGGRQLSEVLLKKYHLQMEMAADSYALAMTSVCDTKEGFARLKDALYEIDSWLAEEEKSMEAADAGPDTGETFREIPHPEYVCSSFLAKEAAKKTGTRQVKLAESEGGVSAEYAYIYPPGIPFLVPGERIKKEMAEYLLHYRDCGFTLEGLKETDHIEIIDKIEIKRG